VKQKIPVKERQVLRAANDVTENGWNRRSDAKDDIPPKRPSFAFSQKGIH